MRLRHKPMEPQRNERAKPARPKRVTRQGQQRILKRSPQRVEKLHQFYKCAATYQVRCKQRRGTQPFISTLGRFMLATKPPLTGSPPLMKTIGMMSVAALAAWA